MMARPGIFPYILSLLQNVASGFSLRRHRLESLCHREIT